MEKRLKTILTILLIIVCIGIFIHQGSQLIEKNYLAKNPCEMCCIKESNKDFRCSELKEIKIEEKQRW